VVLIIVVGAVVATVFWPESITVQLSSLVITGLVAVITLRMLSLAGRQAEGADRAYEEAKAQREISKGLLDFLSVPRLQMTEHGRCVPLAAGQKRKLTIVNHSAAPVTIPSADQIVCTLEPYIPMGIRKEVRVWAPVPLGFCVGLLDLKTSQLTKAGEALVGSGSFTLATAEALELPLGWTLSRHFQHNEGANDMLGKIEQAGAYFVLIATLPFIYQGRQYEEAFQATVCLGSGCRCVE
jgi:hypothetical protein